MGYLVVPSVSTGDSWSAAQHNSYIKDNLAALWQYTTAGDLVYATSATALTRLGIGTDGQVLTVTSGAPAWGQGFPAGVIFDYAGSSVPTGWLDCNGAAISRTTYAALFTAIGTTFGTGDGSTTFNLPDFRGRTSIGVGTGSGLTARSRGDKTGTETHTLTSAQMPSHTHIQDAHSHTIDVVAAYFRDGTSSNDNRAVYGAGNTGSTTATNQNTGGGGSHPNMQPSLAVYKIIKI